MTLLESQLDIRFYNEHHSHVAMNTEAKLRDLEQILKVSEFELGLRIGIALDSILLGSNYNHFSVYYICLSPNHLVGHYERPRHGINIKLDGTLAKQCSSEDLTTYILTYIKDEISSLKGESVPKQEKKETIEPKQEIRTLGAVSAPSLPGFTIEFEPVAPGEELKRMIELTRILKHSKQDLMVGIKEWFEKLNQAYTYDLDTNLYLSLTFHVDITVLPQKPSFGVVLSLNPKYGHNITYTFEQVIEFIHRSVKKQIETIESFLHFSQPKNR